MGAQASPRGARSVRVRRVRPTGRGRYAARSGRGRVGVIPGERRPLGGPAGGDGGGEGGRRGVAAGPVAGLRPLRRRGRARGEQGRLRPLLHRERARPAGLPEPGTLRARDRRDVARPPGRTRRRGGQRHHRRHREHLPGREGGPRPAAAGAARGRRSRGRGRPLRAPGLRQGGALPGRAGGPHADARPPGRPRRDRAGRRRADGADRGLGPGLPVRAGRPDPGPRGPGARARRLAPRRRLRRRFLRPVRATARRGHPGLRLLAARGALDLGRPPQVRLRGQGRLGDPLPRPGRPRAAGLQLRRLAGRALRHGRALPGRGPAVPSPRPGR